MAVLQLPANPDLIDTIPELDEDIDLYLEQLDVADAHPELPRLPAPFGIQNDHDLSRALERARAAAVEVAQLRRLADARIAEVEAWVARASAVPERRRRWYIGRAEEYALGVLGNSTKRVILTVPEGRVVAKPQEPDYKVDRAELGRHLAEMGLGEYVTRKVELIADWAGVKRHTAVQGEVGTTVQVTLGGEPLRGVTALVRPPKAEVTLV